MLSVRLVSPLAVVLLQLTAPGLLAAQAAPSVPEIRALIQQVSDHQKELEKIRENYTWRSQAVTEDLDSGGRVTKTEREAVEIFFVNSHQIARRVEKDGQPLAGHDADKEQERITKLVEKAQNTPPGQPIESREQPVSISRLLDIMDLRNPRREAFRGRATIVFEFVGKKDAKTHGMAEDASKKIAGTIWIDERDHQVARLEARFTDNFHIGGGLVANIQSGSNFTFEQAPVNGEIWLPTMAEARVDARVLLFKGYRQHFVEHDLNYQRFSVDAEPAKAGTAAKPQG